MQLRCIVYNLIMLDFITIVSYRKKLWFSNVKLNSLSSSNNNKCVSAPYTFTFRYWKGVWMDIHDRLKIHIILDPFSFCTCTWICVRVSYIVEIFWLQSSIEWIVKSWGWRLRWPYPNFRNMSVVTQHQQL